MTVQPWAREFFPVSVTAEPPLTVYSMHRHRKRDSLLGWVIRMNQDSDSQSWSWWWWWLWQWRWRSQWYETPAQSIQNACALCLPRSVLRLQLAIGSKRSKPNDTWLIRYSLLRTVVHSAQTEQPNPVFPSSISQRAVKFNFKFCSLIHWWITSFIRSQVWISTSIISFSWPWPFFSFSVSV